MQTKIRIINGEKYLPITHKNARILQKANIPLYQIGNLKTIFIKVKG